MCHRSWTCVAWVFALFAVSAPCPAQVSRMTEDRASAIVAKTHVFVFYSDPLTNLHDFLLNASLEDANTKCFSGLPRKSRDGFEQARAYYKHAFTERRAPRQLFVALRYHLAGFKITEDTDELTAPALAQLQAALPAYKTCWWPAHDRRNRAWVEALRPLLAAHEDALRARFEQLYMVRFDLPHPVDVVSYVGFPSANTFQDPNHTIIGSADPDNAGNAALEMVFHEASHPLLGPNLGAVWQAMQRASVAAGMPQQPFDLWHAVIFYMTGKEIAARFAQSGVTYVPYVYGGGLFDRVWMAFRTPLERNWQPYLEGRADLDTAAGGLMRDLRPNKP